ncbi:hypothetical protein [Schleiferia thermophila]|jgi:hypothetical protein|uniref:hypothetical protein n=1 Tax=Schleiferia thermophila TaxID=884107 RepID=UPI0004E78F0F|nr:hypothetical protein [Schleiferia thermophila]KFD39382.1 hypothetical protein AT05_05545 [Schleiferia thermophila str. Yellowstone]
MSIRLTTCYLFSLLFLLHSACKKDSEIIIPVHQATLGIIRDFKDFKRCLSSDGDTFVARHKSDTTFMAGETVNNQRPVFQVIRHILYISEIDLEITFEITADYHPDQLTRIHDKVLMKIVSNDKFNEMTLVTLPKDWVCLNNCEYKSSLELLGQTYQSVLCMRLPEHPNIYYSIGNDGKFAGFSCSAGKIYRWID